MPNIELLTQTLSLIDNANKQDPNTVTDENGAQWPKELLYSERMTDMLNRFTPNADEVAQIAVRAQHIERWKSQRSSYPAGREGYLQWRSQLYRFHAENTAAIMAHAGYDEASIARVKQAVGKRGIKTNEDAQLVEDISGLVFIEYYMLEFAQQHPEYSEEKWLNIIRKTWNKMSEAAQQFALSGKVNLPESLVPLIKKAVS